MFVTAAVKKGIDPNKQNCDDSLLLNKLSHTSKNSTIIWNGNFVDEIPRNMAYMAAVADGVGGRNAGNIASQFVLNRIAALMPLEEVDPQWIFDEIHLINADLLRYSESQQQLRGMATTLSGIISFNSSAILFHVGNSRIYITDGRFIRQITRDHTPTQGQITADNRILACMGGGDASLLSMLQVEIIKLPDRESGGSIILTSDGIHDHIDKDDISAALKQRLDGQHFCDSLINLALENKSFDDLSIMLLTI